MYFGQHQMEPSACTSGEITLPHVVIQEILPVTLILSPTFLSSIMDFILTPVSIWALVRDFVPILRTRRKGLPTKQQATLERTRLLMEAHL